MAKVPRRYLKITSGPIGADETTIFAYTGTETIFYNTYIESTSFMGSFHQNPSIKIVNLPSQIAENLIGAQINVYAGYINSPLGNGLILSAKGYTVYSDPNDNGVGVAQTIYLLDVYPDNFNFTWQASQGNLAQLLTAFLKKAGLKYVETEKLTENTQNLIFKGTFERLISQISRDYGVEIFQKFGDEFTAIRNTFVIASRTASITKLVNTSTGMVRYPTLIDINQCVVATLIRADIRPGDLITIQSERFAINFPDRGFISFPVAGPVIRKQQQNFQGAGSWLVMQIQYQIAMELDSDGAFIQVMTCVQQKI